MDHSPFKLNLHFCKKSKSFTPARKSMLKLVKLPSLVAKCCKIRKIYACKVCKFCILFYYSYHKMAEIHRKFLEESVVLAGAHKQELQKPPFGFFVFLRPSRTIKILTVSGIFLPGATFWISLRILLMFFSTWMTSRLISGDNRTSLSFGKDEYFAI